MPCKVVHQAKSETDELESLDMYVAISQNNHFHHKPMQTHRASYPPKSVWLLHTTDDESAMAHICTKSFCAMSVFLMG